MENHQTCIFIKGIVTGIVMGGLTAALLAPKNGRETRNGLVGQGQEWQRQAKETKEDITKRGETLSSSMKERKDHVVSTLQEQAKVVADRSKQALDTTYQEWNELKDESLLAASHAREGVQEEKERLKQDIDQAMQRATIATPAMDEQDPPSKDNT